MGQGGAVKAGLSLAILTKLWFGPFERFDPFDDGLLVS
jgi:hypothetical protein